MASPDIGSINLSNYPVILLYVRLIVLQAGVTGSQRL
jgi:hypothetical protein